MWLRQYNPLVANVHQPELAYSNVKQIREFFPPPIIVDVKRIPNFAILDNLEWEQSGNLAILTFPPPPTRKTNHTPTVLSDLNCTLTRDIKL
jgi:hypothetical protein